MGNPYDKKEERCEHNFGVQCEELKLWKEGGMQKDWPCRNCGWRPEIEAMRKKEAYLRFDKRTPGQKLDDLVSIFNKGLISREDALKSFYFIRKAVFGE